MSTFQNILIPGGLGFIGSHTIVEILQNTSFNCIIVDDLSNCFPDVLPRVRKIVTQTINPEDFDKRVKFHQGNILDLEFLDSLFKEYSKKGEPLEGIMHFAALKAGNESFQKPLEYFQNNFVGSMNLFKMMEKHKECKRFIFSSTAAVYGEKDNCVQTDKMDPQTPYGESKAAVEMLISSLARVHPQWRIIVLRYFNPCGAHSSGLLGDQPYIYPNNLFPFVQDVVMGKREKLYIFGNDYETQDGTGVRDYIHITDLAKGHLFALKKLTEMEKNYDVVNLGSGIGYSVHQVIKGFEEAANKKLNWEYAGRRTGDLPRLVANPSKANKQWGWKTEKTLADMCKDCVNFINVRLSRKSSL